MKIQARRILILILTLVAQLSGLPVYCQPGEAPPAAILSTSLAALYSSMALSTTPVSWRSTILNKVPWLAVLLSASPHRKTSKPTGPQMGIPESAKVSKDLTAEELFELAVEGENQRAETFHQQIQNDPTLIAMEARTQKPLRQMKIDQFELVRKHGFKTTDGSTIYHSVNSNRSAARTYHWELDGFKVDTAREAAQWVAPPELAEKIWDAVQRFIENKELIQVDRSLGKDPNKSRHFRLLVSKSYGRLAHELTALHFPRPGAASATPNVQTIDLPDFDISEHIPDLSNYRDQNGKPFEQKKQPFVLRIPSRGINLILGTDYFGEIKKSALTTNGVLTKQQGNIAIHAGSKVVVVRDAVTGRLKRVRSVVTGLSGTGKTTTVIGKQGLGETDPEESSDMKQDDFVELRLKRIPLLRKIIGIIVRALERGTYYKTERLDPKKEPELYRAAQFPETVLSNVWMNETAEGLVPNNDNVELTANGRGVVPRERISDDPTVDMDGVDYFIFLTRRDTLVPPMAICSTPAQAAAFWTLGESQITSAADPKRAGESTREAGFSSFIVGPVSEEANRMMEIFKAFPKAKVVILNTGSVGAQWGKDESGNPKLIRPGVKIDVPDSAKLLRALYDGSLKTTIDPEWGYTVAQVEDRLNPRTYYSNEQYSDLTERLRAERKAWLSKFAGLHPSILRAVEKPAPHRPWIERFFSNISMILKTLSSSVGSTSFQNQKATGASA